MDDLRKLIRDIPDFPQPGIIFRDITTLLRDAKSFKSAIDLIGQKYIDKKVDLVAGIEARGFIIGAALAYKLGAGIVVIRKPGKLPHKTHRISYQLEYGTDELEIHSDSVDKGQRVLIVDDLLATGGTVGAVINLLKKFDGNIVGLAFLVELTFLRGRQKLNDYDIFSLIQY